jgi:hypothetical protein
MTEGMITMARKMTYTPEELVDAEIERLKQTEAVKLAQKERRLLINRKRKYLADLRWLEKRGKELLEEGWSLDTLELLYKENTEDQGD